LTWQKWLLLVACLAAVSCQPESVRQEKNTRRQLAHEMRNHSYVSAAPLARQLLQRNSRDERIWKQLVRAQIGLHDLDGAKDSLRQWHAAVASPSPRFDEFQGDIAWEERENDGASAAWQRVTQAQPKNRRVRQKIALLNQTQGKWSEAEAEWNTVLQSKDTAAGRINRALCRRHLRRWKDVFDDFHRARELSPDDPEVHRWSRLFEELEKYAEQIAEFDAKLAILPDDVSLLGDRALLFLLSGDPELGLEDAQRAAKLASWAIRPKLFQAIALILLNRGRECDALSVRRPLTLDSLTPEFLESISRLDLAIAVERTNPEHFIMRSWHLNEIGQAKLALQDAETAVRLDSKSAGALTELSYALTKLGRADEAFEKVKQATEFDSNSAAAWQYRGELEMTRGNYLAAVESFSRALGIHQTIAVLQKREESYRRLGLNARADEDHRAVQKLMTTAFQ
jgi:tetratricopeptide (TPR) repeat protein